MTEGEKTSSFRKSFPYVFDYVDGPSDTSEAARVCDRSSSLGQGALRVFGLLVVLLHLGNGPPPAYRGF